MGGFLPISCTLLIIFQGWTFVNALSIIVYSSLQFGKEIDQGLQHFMEFLWQGDLVLFFLL